MLESQEKWKEADAEYRLAIQANPRFVEPYIRLGDLYMDHDYDKEAVQVFQNAVLAAADDGNAHYRLGLALQKTKQYEEAVKEVQASGYTVAPTHLTQVTAAYTSAQVALGEMKSSGENPQAIADQKAYVAALKEAVDMAVDGAVAAAQV